MFPGDEISPSRRPGLTCWRASMGGSPQGSFHTVPTLLSPHLHRTSPSLCLQCVSTAFTQVPVASFSPSLEGQQRRDASLRVIRVPPARRASAALVPKAACLRTIHSQAPLEPSCTATPGLERQEEACAALRSTTSWESMEVTGSRPHRIAQGKCRAPWKHRSPMPNSAWGKKGRSQHPPERRCLSQTLKDQWESARQTERDGIP